MKLPTAIQILENELSFVKECRQRLALTTDPSSDPSTYAEGLADSDRKIEALKLAIESLQYCKNLLEFSQKFEL